MDIKRVNYSTQSFKGYGAVPVRYFVTRLTENKSSDIALAKEIAAIGKKNGFGVLMQSCKRIIYSSFDAMKNDKPFPAKYGFLSCSQDSFHITRQNILMTDMRAGKDGIALSNYLKCRDWGASAKHIPGGNFYVIKNNNGTYSAIYGKDEMKFFDNIDKIAQRLGTNELYPVSQADYHIDLFMRPLKGKDVLIADDEMTLDILNEAVKKCHNYLEKNKDDGVAKVKHNLDILIEMFKDGIQTNPYVKPVIVQEELRKQGFNVIKVPGRIYRPYFEEEDQTILHYFINYMNALVHEKNNGDLVFITNDTLMNEKLGITAEISQKIGFDFKKCFTESIKDFVKPENVYFLGANNAYLSRQLEYSATGIHCLYAEIPRFNVRYVL